MPHECSYYSRLQLKRPAYPETVVVATFLKVLCTSQFSAAVGTGFFSDTEKRKICSIWRHASTTTKWLATINVLFMKYTKSRRGMSVVLAKPRGRNAFLCHQLTALAESPQFHYQTQMTCHPCQATHNGCPSSAWSGLLHHHTPAPAKQKQSLL